jgi:hypothetical protein
MNIELGSFRDVDTPKPTAWIRDDGVIAFHPKTEVDSQGFKWFPLYLQPQKYCPSEENDAYEKGFIEGMAKMTESAVHRAVEGVAVKELTDEEIYEIAMEVQTGFLPQDDTLAFARAILRKAQEKCTK